MKEVSIDQVVQKHREISIASAAPAALTWPAMLRGETSDLLLRMFRDPRVLEPNERGDLIAQLRTAVDLEPRVPEIRVLLGMALCCRSAGAGSSGAIARSHAPGPRLFHRPTEIRRVAHASAHLQPGGRRDTEGRKTCHKRLPGRTGAKTGGDNPHHASRRDRARRLRQLIGQADSVSPPVQTNPKPPRCSPGPGSDNAR